MNPKLTVTVDAKNRAITTASGMVTVGAKVDVVVVGLPDGIPEWGEGDVFTGSSLRLRIVDECGHDLVRYPLAEGDAWNDEGETLSASTPVEFDTDALRRAFCGVAFSEARDFGIILDSAVDDAQYAVGRIKIRQWAIDSTEDPMVLPDWRETLAELRTNLAAVKDERIAAESARTAAETAAGNAADSERTAATSAGAAQTAQNAARTSELAAAKSADEAKSAREGAEQVEAETKTLLAVHTADRANPHGVTKEQIGLGNADNTSDAAKPISDATQAALDGLDVKIAAKADLVDGKIPAAQLPSYVDDVIECDALADFPEAGERGKIYVALDTNLTYRWSGSAYVEISPSPDLTPYAKKTDVTKAVNAEESRTVSVENLKADKTTVSGLSSSVDSLKSSKRGAYDLAVYRRAVSVQLKITVADNSDGTVLGTSETGVYCTFVKSGYSIETYRGQFGENSYLSLTLVVEGGEIVGGAYGEVEFEGESAIITNLNCEGGNRVTGSTTLTTGAEFFLYEVKGTIENDTSTSDHGTLLTSADGAALKSSAVSDAVSQARTAAKADRPFDVADMAAGATLANATVSRFSPADASEVAFTLADPPSGKMAEYELWVDCTAAAPASLTFRLANAQIDPRVEGGVEAMAVGKAYAYRVRAFGNPDAAHVTVIISQSEAAPAGYTPDQLYAPDSAFEIDTTKGDGLTFSVQVGATASSGDNGYATVVWGDGTSTRRSATSSTLTEFTHTYAKAGNYVVRIANADRFYLAGSPMVVRALRWGDTVTAAPGTYSACLNLAGTVPPWGKAMVNTTGSTSSGVIYPGSGDYGNASTGHGAFAFCTGLTGSVPPWPELGDDSRELQALGKTFIGCTGLTGSIPPWPKHVTKVNQCFYGCTGLTGSVPEWPEFADKPWYVSGSGHPIASAYGAFAGCVGLTGEIPAWPALPKNSIPKLGYPSSTYADYDYFGTFAGCTGLTGKIPKWPCNTTDGAFLNAWVAGLYAGCTGLEGIWDEDAADSEVMPSTATKHADCVKGASEAVRRHFTEEWGGTKGASST